MRFGKNTLQARPIRTFMGSNGCQQSAWGIFEIATDMRIDAFGGEGIADLNTAVAIITVLEK